MRILSRISVFHYPSIFQSDFASRSYTDLRYKVSLRSNDLYRANTIYAKSYFAPGAPPLCVQWMFLSQHDFIHLVLSPFRMVCCSISSQQLCHDYNDDGIPHFVAFGINLLHWLDDLDMNILLQASLFVFAFTLFSSLKAAEIACYALGVHGLVAVMVLLALSVRSGFISRWTRITTPCPTIAMARLTCSSAKASAGA